jgi:hypothetical protein
MICREASELLDARINQGWFLCRGLDRTMYHSQMRFWLNTFVGPMVDGEDMSDSMDNGDWDFINDNYLIRDRAKAILFVLATGMKIASKKG